MIRPAVVLVRPENNANIGAVARVMKNTGLSDLRLVDPSDWRTLETWRTAWAAQEILEGARVFRTLDEALRGSTMALALSGRDDQVVVLDVREGVRQLGAAPEGASTCLVFGPEQSGLTFEEMALCGRRAAIPSHPAQPSYNLSHAVAITAYFVIGSWFEERKLVALHGEAYRHYRDKVPALLPLPWKYMTAAEARSFSCPTI